MAFWFFFFAFIGSALLGELLRPDPKVNNAKPAGLGDFSFPTVSESRPIPVIFGRNLIKGANVIWYGNYSVVPVTTSQRVKTGLFSKKTVTQVTGFRYFITIHCGLSLAGIDYLYSFRVAERVAWSGTLAANLSAAVNQPDLFGGLDKDGGYVGTLALRSGTQSTFAGLFRGYQMLSMFEWVGEIGTNPYIKEWALEAGRYPSALGFGAISQGCNPAEMLYEILTDTDYGAGFPSFKIDTASFQAAAAIFLAEGFALSLHWDQRRTFEDYCGEILRHVDALMPINPTTGLRELNPNRDPGDPDLLPLLGPDEIADVSNFSRGAIDATINEVKVVYTERARNYKDSTVSVQNTANFELQGRVFSTAPRYPGIHSPTLANQVALRDLKALTIPLAKGTIRVNRIAHDITEGKAFRLVWPDLGITQLVMRANRIRYGTLESGMMEIEAVQDVFSLDSAIFADPDPPEWTNPIGGPTPFVVEELSEMPYQFMADPEIVAIYGDPDDARLDARGEKPSSSTYEFQVDARVHPLPDFDEDRGAHDGFAPTGTLESAYPAGTAAIDESGTLVVENTQDIILVQDTTDAEILAGAVNLAYIGAELVAFRTITDNLDGTYTLDGVYRGMWDTVPADHSVGERVWFWFYGRTWSLDTFDLGDDVRAKLIPKTSLGQLDRGLAGELQRTITARALRPLPPGNTTMNTVYWPELVHEIGDPGDQDDLLTGPMVAGWADRDRTQQLEGVVTQVDGTDIGPEAGVTYTIRIYDEDDVLARTVPALSSPSYTWSHADELSDTGRRNERIRFELESVRGGLVSHQLQERTGDFTGLGMRFGEDFGGV